MHKDPIAKDALILRDIYPTLLQAQFRKEPLPSYGKWNFKVVPTKDSFELVVNGDIGRIDN